jgi:hypothetical protein
MTPLSPPSSGRSEAPLHLILEPSRTLSRAIVAVHGLAGFCALANPLPLWAKSGLIAAIGLSLYLTFRDHVSNPAFRGLSLSPDGHWEVVRRSGTVAAILAPGTVATRWIVLLHLDSEAGSLAIPICRDGTDPESFRRLRVHLRTVGMPREEAS